MILLYTLDTAVTKFQITTADETFQITPQTYGFSYELWAGGQVQAACKLPYDIVNVVHQHRTGYEPWDGSDELAPDSLAGWTCHVNDQTKIQLLSDCINSPFWHSYREVVDYFHFKHPYLLDRCQIANLIEDLAITGQLEKLPSDWMTPAELSLTSARVKKWWNADRRGA